VQLAWQWATGPHELDAQYRFTSLKDSRAYSPLLDNGAIRDSQNHYAAIRYRRLMSNGFSLLFNLTHQNQKSNLAPFNNRGTVAEAGLSLPF
jgi:hypothetical protein